MLSQPFPLNKEACAKALAEPDTPATVLHAIVLTAYGDELYGNPEAGIEPMDAVELWLRIREDFGVNVPEEVENKINAIMLAVSTNAFYEDPQAFVSITLALAHGDLGDLVSGVFEDVTVPEIAAAIYEVALNRDDDPEFSAEVQREIDKEIREEAEDLEEGESPLQANTAALREEIVRGMQAIGVSPKVLEALA